MSLPNPVRTVVVPAAGWGTRFLPATKSVPKELLPIIDKPVIQYGLEEALDSGLSRAILVNSPGKAVLDGYFQPRPDLNHFLASKQKLDLISGLDRITDNLEISSVIQHQQLGLGHAVLTARQAIGPEPFAVLLPDDVITSNTPALRQLFDVYDARQASVLAVQKVPRDRISGYGVIDSEQVGPGLHRVKALVEKPVPDDAPSDLGIVGRYVLTPGILHALASTQPGALGEIQLTDAIANLLDSEPVYALEFEGTRYDAGNPLGLIQASVSIGLTHPHLGSALRAFLANLDLSTGQTRSPTSPPSTPP